MIKRRMFGLMAGTSMLALVGGGRRIIAQAATADASLLKTTLTPNGAERAGNAAGTIPAWTGGLTEIPAGFESWDPTKTLPPDFFAGDKMLYEVNASNLSQYADLLSEGVQALIKNVGYQVQVFQTHRTHAVPQWVSDFTAANVGRAQPNPGGGRLGFTGGYGGVPFPIPDSDPTVAGAQILWNHLGRWPGSYWQCTVTAYTVPNGEVTLVNAERAVWIFPYYQQDGNLETFDGYFFKVAGPGQFAPANVAGGQIVSFTSSDPLAHPPITWQLLAGQGRVRKAPEVLYDTPDSYADGIVNYDENFGFNGPLDKYDWKCLGKKEMLIPYNNNKIFQHAGATAHLDKFFDPALTRWELHRVWVVEATLHPGERNVLSRRMMYIDEDTWTIGLVDSWDAHGAIQRAIMQFNANFPNLPGTIFMNCLCYDLPSTNYVSLQGSYADALSSAPWTFHPVPEATFEPQAMAAAAAY